MSTTNSSTTGTTVTASTGGAAPAPTKVQKIAQIVELCGGGAFLAGGILSVHHYAIGACFVGGAAAFFAGRKFAKG